ncbi:archaeal ATPase family protein [Parabacteroides distasonis str. 3776 D15 iv]|uniref:Archaeal ATPase family protein n=1 Tax=Parabacteroides distasonis str. 3776 D15 i TaxID=1339342 RepID=A0AB34LBR2_PARDI|nr:ATP-binding protein [Parabacteroides distasonis]KDS37463.1 archaeal ATPase family protein [Parabacteroides distasonis str. 3776 D15 i]KDS47629.1 archaeal ATPase family protein [Parabacteroides distasonis str. 3776 Po2 i]KDS73139.1 archaeal ATPase family protein [Parabacteroides distasonis str. 3776 D15 iv]UVR27354.1 ATP-binding protein [Parabacteroides distasonis]WMI44192.1 ATP-binding protein [Parabacteroides distasonis]
MERTVLKELIEWKERADRKPLILNGARQVGKTWLLHEFARLEYKKEAYVVCRKNNLARQLFTQDFDVERILRGLRAMTSVDITPGDTLVILDEVQDIPEVLEALKYFKEEAPDYHIAVAGSLLGISLHENVSYPVGKVNVINLYPMSFEEFLMAKGEKEACKLLMSRDYGMMSLLHEKYVDLLRQYYYVGGMPEAVSKYVETGALREVRRIQQEILQGYDLDFSKHAPKEQVPRIRMVWNSVPSQLFKENKKFIYGALRKGARANDFELSIQWLVNAGLLYKVPRCAKPELPLAVYEDLSAFKLYMVDLGLMGAMVQTDPAQVLIKNDIFKEYKGGLTEQYVLQQMKSKGVSPIYYRTADNSRLELDFIIQRGAEMIPIEVKAEGNVRANSLMNLLDKVPSLHAERYSMLPYKEQGNLTNIPLYAV